MRETTTSANFTVDWHSRNIPHWREILERYKGRPDVRVLEIGSYEGRSAVWLLENILTHPTARIDCVDTFAGSPEHVRMGIDMEDLHVRFLINIEPYREKVSVSRGPSQEILRDRWLGPYDIVYIDGSHAAADVLEDAVLAFRLLKVGGLMIFDDYAWDSGPTEFDNPRRGIEAFYYAYQDQLRPAHVSYQAIFERINPPCFEPESEAIRVLRIAPGAPEHIAALRELIEGKGCEVRALSFKSAEETAGGD